MRNLRGSGFVGGKLLASLVGIAVAGGALAEDDRFAAYNANPTLVAPTDAETPQKQRTMFRLPPGFEIERIASEPDIKKPMNIAFDRRGRLWLTDSLAYPFPAKEGEHPADGIRYIEDTNGDGVPDKVRTFVDGLNIPIGVLPLREGAIGFSIPTIFRFHDGDGDGASDEKSPLYGTFGFQDTHGMASSFSWWVDGWVYSTHGFANRSEIKGADGKTVVLQSGNTYRFRPDGGGVEPFTHGQVNPFGMSFDPWGNLFTADCHTKPAYNILRGAWYPMFGNVHDGLGMGPELMGHLHGSTGIAGVVYYAAEHFPAEYRGNLFIGNPVSGRVNLDRLEKKGGSYRAVEKPDFLSCADPWFRPVALALAPDGTLYIADFYNKIIGHYEVPLDHPQRDRFRGRIWRVVYKGTKDVPAPPPRKPADLMELSDAALAEKLADPNLTVRTLATHELVERGPRVEPVVRALLQPASDPHARAHALWVLERLGRLEEAELARRIEDEEAIVRVHALKAAAERSPWPDSSGLGRAVRARLGDQEGFARRAAAEALGLHPRREFLEPLLELWARTPLEDAHLVHVVRMAARNVLAADADPVAVLEGYRDQQGRIYQLTDVALGSKTPKSAALVARALAWGAVDRNRLGEFIAHVARGGEDPTVEELYRIVRALRLADGGTQRSVLLALHQGHQERGRPLPAEFDRWASSLAGEQLASMDPNVARDGIDLARDMRLKGLLARLWEYCAPTSPHPSLRAHAMDAVLPIDAAGSMPVLLSVLRDLSDDLGARAKAAEVLGMIHQPAAIDGLSAQLPTAPERLAVSIARGLSRTDQGSEKLLSLIDEGKAPAALLRDGVVVHELHFRSVRDKEARLARLTRSLPPEDEKIAKLIEDRRKGFSSARPDAAKGKVVFEKSCAKCHQVAGQGAKVGPQLDGVGLRGLERLLEDVLRPSQNVDQAFRATLVVLDDGRLVNGLFLREEGEVVVLADAEGKEVRLKKEEIVDRKPSTLSPMPIDVGVQIPEPDFYDLFAYLLAQRAAPAGQASAGGP